MVFLCCPYQCRNNYWCAGDRILAYRIETKSGRNYKVWCYEFGSEHVLRVARTFWSPPNQRTPFNRTATFQLSLVAQKVCPGFWKLPLQIIFVKWFTL